MSDKGWSRYIGEQEEAHETACYKAAEEHGLTQEEADTCDDGDRGCPKCPWLEKCSKHPLSSKPKG